MELAGEGATPMFLRLAGVTAPYLSVQLVPERQFTDGESRDLLALAAVLGFMVAMLAYNLVIYLRSRLHQCLYYFMYLGFMIVHIAIYDGLVGRFSGLVVSGTLADDLALAFVIAAAVSLLLFGRLLLDLPRTFPRSDKAILILAAGMTLALALEVSHLTPIWLATSILSLAAGSLMCGLAVARALRGHRPAIYFSLSFLALLLGVALDSVGFFFPVAVSPEPTFLARRDRCAAELVVPYRYLRRSGADFLRDHLFHPATCSRRWSPFARTPIPRAGNTRKT